MAKSLAEDILNVEKSIDSENFQIWKFQINILLAAHELNGVVLQNV